jgi:hypothetical protein
VNIRDDNVSRLNGAAEGIAAALGPDWTVSRPASSDYPSGLIISDGTRELHFYLPYNSDKVDLSGIYPDVGQSVTLYEKGERVGRPRIGFSVKRPAPTVARDIERRFLPEYDRVRALVVQRLEADATDDARQAAAVTALAAALDVEPRNGSTELSTPMSDRAGYGDFRPNHNGSSWEITLRSVPTNVATLVAEIMAASRQER